MSVLGSSLGIQKVPTSGTYGFWLDSDSLVFVVNFWDDHSHFSRPPSSPDIGLLEVSDSSCVLALTPVPSPILPQASFIFIIRLPPRPLSLPAGHLRNTQSPAPV